MKTTRIIAAALAAVTALTPTAGYTFCNTADIPGIAAAAETVMTVTYKGRNYTYCEEYSLEYVICDGMYFRTVGDEAVLTDVKDLYGDVVIPEEVPLVSELKNAPSGTAEYSGKTAKVTEIAENAFTNQEHMTSVTIPDSVTAIGEWAFLGCDALAKVNVTDRYISLGRHCFDNVPWYENQAISGSEAVFCGNLLSVPDVEEYTVPEGVKAVYSAGWGLKNLKKLNIPEGVEYIIGSFSDCENLSEVVLPLSLKEADQSFEECPALEGLYVAATAEEWAKTGRYITSRIPVFDKDGQLLFEPKEPLTGIYEPYSEIRGEVKTELKVGESVEFSVFGRGFTPELSVLQGDSWIRDEKAMKLELIGRESDIGDTLNTTEKYRITAVEPGTFRFMPYMTMPWTAYADQLIFTVTDGETPAEEPAGPEYTFTSEDGADYITGGGMKFRRAGQEAILVSGKDAEGVIVIPEEIPVSAENDATVRVTEIGDSAFINNKKITSVIIPAGVEMIGNKAFCGCEELGTVSAPDNYIELGTLAFSGTKWYNFTRGDTMVFAGNLIDISEEAEEVIVPDGVRVIYNAGRSNTHLKKLVIPEGVERIEGSFNGCESLTEVILPLSLRSIESSFSSPAPEKLTVDGTAEEWNRTGRYIDRYAALYDKNGQLIYEPAEPATQEGSTGSRQKGEVKTDLRAGESTELTVVGTDWNITVLTRNGDKWISDPYALRLREKSREKSHPDSDEYSLTYTITAADPGEYRIRVWGAARTWPDWYVGFNVTEDEAPAAVLSGKAGDANEDGKLTVSDAVAVLQFIANKSKYPLTETGLANADIDGEEGITGGDAAAIQRLDAGLPLTE